MTCERMRMDESYYKKFYDTAPIGFFITTMEDGTFLKANPCCLEILGFKDFNKMKKSLRATDIYPADQREHFIKIIQQHGHVTDFEVELHLPNGRRKWVSLSARACGDNDCIEGSILDISERKALEEALAEYKTEAVKELQTLQKSMNVRIKQCNTALGLIA